MYVVILNIDDYVSLELILLDFTTTFKKRHSSSDQIFLDISSYKSLKFLTKHVFSDKVSDIGHMSHFHYWNNIVSTYEVRKKYE